MLKETFVQKSIAPIAIEKREIAPVVHERIRREEVEEIQPVIHREREKTEIHKITQPIHTNQTMGVVTEERSLPAQFTEFRTPAMAPPPAVILPTSETLAAQKVRIEKAPVIIETEKKRIIEEVQPVVYKETVQPHFIKLTQPIYEKIVEGEVYVTQTMPIQFQQGFFQQQKSFIAQPTLLGKNVEVANTFVNTTNAPLGSSNNLFGADKLSWGTPGMGNSWVSNPNNIMANQAVQTTTTSTSAPAAAKHGFFHRKH
jgi:hypothetical protein